MKFILDSVQEWGGVNSWTVDLHWPTFVIVMFIDHL